MEEQVGAERPEVKGGAAAFAAGLFHASLMAAHTPHTSTG